MDCQDLERSLDDVRRQVGYAEDDIRNLNDTVGGYRNSALESSRQFRAEITELRASIDGLNDGPLTNLRWTIGHYAKRVREMEIRVSKIEEVLKGRPVGDLLADVVVAHLNQRMDSLDASIRAIANYHV